MITPDYNLFIKDVSSGDEYDLPFLNITFTEELNKGKNASVSFDFLTILKIAETYNTTPLFLFTGGIRELRIEKNNVIIYRGVISDSSVGKDDKGLLKIDIASVGFVNLLTKRFTGQKRLFTNTDAGTIAFTLINESQLTDPPHSDFGITSGLIQPSINRDRTFRFDNILDSIFKMSNENLKNGFDFEIDNLKKFNIFFPQKGSNRENFFIDEHNIISWKFQKPLVLNLANRVHVLGEGFDDNLIFTTRTSDVAYRQAFGLLEAIQSERDTGILANLNDKGDKFLLDNQSPRLKIEIIHKDNFPDITEYNVGDSLKIKLPEAEINNQFTRVKKRTVKIDTQEQALVTIFVE